MGRAQQRVGVDKSVPTQISATRREKCQLFCDNRLIVTLSQRKPTPAPQQSAKTSFTTREFSPMTLSTVLLCLLAAKAVSELLSLFLTHPLVDLGAGVLFGLGAIAMLVANPGNGFAYAALAISLYWLAQGATALSKQKRLHARAAGAA
jgi:hypothetical protein